MKLGEIYRRAVQTGTARDPRGTDEVKRALAAVNKEFEALKEEDKPYFDTERLTNPYGDSRLLHGDPETEVRAILAGIDIGEGELLLADRLREKGRPVDCCLSHHPGGHALAQLPGVMTMQSALYAGAGVPIGQAEGVLAPRIAEIASRVQPVNHQRTGDVARLLEMPYLCLHTVADNCVSSYLDELFVKEAPDTLGDIMELLYAIPEFDLARRDQTGPVLVAGTNTNRAGKIFMEMTGGTEGATEMYEKLARSGEVSTIVGMHLSKEHVEAAKAQNLNIILAGHVSADNLGVNLLFDGCLDPDVEVICAGGFRRVTRNS